MRKSWIIALALVISACAPGSAILMLDEAMERDGGMTDATLDRAAAAVDKYCMTVPEMDRAEFRRRFNERTNVGDLNIDC